MKKILGSAAVGLLVATILSAGLVAGCGTGKTPPTSLKPTAPATAPSSSATTTPSASSALPRYQPTTVVSDTPGSLQMTSPDSLQKVSAFYDTALKQGGWSIISSSKTAANTSITAKQGSTGTTLSISVTSSGCYISLTTYPI